MFKKGIAELDQNTLSEEAELAAKAEEVCCADEACPWAKVKLGDMGLPYAYNWIFRIPCVKEEDGQAAPELSNRDLTITVMWNSPGCVSKGPRKSQETLELGLNMCSIFCQLISILFQAVMLTAGE